MQSKERAKQPLPFAAGYIDPWCHIFTFLPIIERFSCHRICCHLKAILGTSSAWQQLSMDSMPAKSQIDALVRLARRVTLQFSSVVYSSPWWDARLWHELGAQRILSSKVREIVLKPRFIECYRNEFGWSGDLTDTLAACSHALTSLTLPICILLKNLPAMRTLTSLKKLVINECSSSYCLFGKNSGWLKETLQGLAKHVMPQITDLTLCPYHQPSDSDLKELQTDVVLNLLPAATSLRSLSLRGFQNPEHIQPIAIPTLQHLSTSWTKVTITPETAASLQSLDIGLREFDHTLLPPLPALQSLSFCRNSSVCDPELGYAVLRKTPNVKQYSAYHSLMVFNDDDDPRHWFEHCDLVGANLRSQFRYWWMARIGYARASNKAYNDELDDTGF